MRYRKYLTALLLAASAAIIAHAVLDIATEFAAPCDMPW